MPIDHGFSLGRRRWLNCTGTGLLALPLGASLGLAAPAWAARRENDAVLGEAGARHLLARTGFGARPADLAAYAGLTRVAAVDRLLARPPTAPLHAPPADALEYVSPQRLKEMREEDRKAFQQERFRVGAEMRAWWLQEMIEADPSRALVERMTLFWHNHFVSSDQKVHAHSFMVRQNLLFRENALGNFGDLLHAVGKDPAMLVYLDGAQSRRESPNENFAREVMELFTLGRGHYQEGDIREAARAFTGWSIEPQTGEFRWRPFFHDTGVKTVLGRSGNFDGDQVLDILLAQPVCAEFIAAKLWQDFVAPPGDDPTQARAIQRLAAVLRDSGYDLRATLRALLLSEAFWASQNRGRLVKSPVDLVAGTVRTLDVTVPDALPLAFIVRNLGQDLFAPPNVRGWPGGEAWINSTTLLARKAFLERLLRGEDFVEPMRHFDGQQARYDDAAPAMKRRTAQLREAFGQVGGRMDGDARFRLVAAWSAVRVDSSRLLDRFPDRRGLEAALLAVPPVNPNSLVAGGMNDAPTGLALIRALALDPAYQLL